MKCRQCRRHVFTDPNAALEHLRDDHLKGVQAPLGRDPQNARNLKDWIYSWDQCLIEKTLGSAFIFLDRAIESSRTFRDQLKELADGVRNNTGALADLYTFPDKLIETFRRLVLYYLAVENAFHHLDKWYYQTRQEPPSDGFPEIQDIWNTVQELREDVKVPLLQAREALCDMARSPKPVDLGQRVSLSAEYVCSWLMRRLVVKPLDRNSKYFLVIECVYHPMEWVYSDTSSTPHKLC
jgi:hypothetical protein